MLKVLDLYCRDPKDIFIVGCLGLKYAKEYAADRLECPAGLTGFFSNQTDLTYRLKKKKRLYLFYPRSNDSPLARLAKKIKLDYCDSDTAFT